MLKAVMNLAIILFALVSRNKSFFFCFFLPPMIIQTKDDFSCAEQD